MSQALRREEKPPFIPVDFAAVKVEVEDRADGTVLVRHPDPCPDYPDHVCFWLQKWATEAPDRTFIAQRPPEGGDWERLTYAQAEALTNAICQSLLNRNFPAERPVMILSGNSIRHALLTLGAIKAGIPVAPVSVAYSLMSEDHGKLRHVFDLVEPHMVFAEDGAMFAKALASLDLDGIEVVCARNAPDDLETAAFEALTSSVPTEAVAKSLATIGPDTVIKYLFTSGSTGMPKAVINTNRMVCANQVQTRAVRGSPEAPVILDWLPWNHTYGGNANFFGNLTNGGTMYIDGGKPLPGLFDVTLANLRDVATTSYLNVPAGFAMLADVLENDEELLGFFFSRLQYIAYGGAGLPDELYERFQQLSIRATGKRVVFLTGFGSTETAPVATTTYWANERVGLIGLPMPGVELKLVPNAGKQEIRIRGEIVTPGYYRQPKLTEAAFDEEGFYRIGDAAKFIDPKRPELGMVFDGRVTEDFKLRTGTWVSTGMLRLAAIDSLGPFVQDAAVAGHDQNFVGLLAFPNMEACRRAVPPGTPDAEVLTHPDLQTKLRERLEAHNAKHPGSSTRVGRLVMLAEPPSVDGHEITDKGYLNQRSVLERRAEFVKRLYAEPPPDDVVAVM